MHPGAGKAELQSLINETKWKALVMRQKRPMQRLVSSDAPPHQDTILTQFGCILVVPSVDRERTQSKGKGKGKKGGKNVVIGGHAMGPQVQAVARPLQALQNEPPVQRDVNGPIQTAFTQLEEKVQERLAVLKQEAVDSHNMLEQDIKNMRAEFSEHVRTQKVEAASLPSKDCRGRKRPWIPVGKLHDRVDAHVESAEVGLVIAASARYRFLETRADT